MTEKALFNWSGGKDSAMALYELKKSNGYEITGLLTTITEDYDRISMHAVRRVLLEKQADFLRIHLGKVFISKQFSNEEYKSRMMAVFEK
jgi:diphthamide synthase (EF-2-diphthine--ammonia ligase)